jgi:alanyl-tRNA synthetase
MKTDEIREKYLTFFEEKGCKRCPSDVLVPRWDPTVLFTPAGMNPFKDHFLGKVKLEFTRATSSQKCLRTGDIDNVGRTAYHHTFFEMLGNFSFGDYFKHEAIHWAWEWLTDKKWLGLDGSKLSVTVYLDDDEAADIWHKEIKLPLDRITRCGEDENFWPAEAPSKGPDGVCGPCSEIYYDVGNGKKVEIWNLVFTQFNRVGDPPNNLKPLPKQNIDTGMGLERIASVMQGVDTNYHIDTIRPLVEMAAEVCGKKYDPKSDDGRRFRRIADHVRACTFAVHEEVYPGPKKQGYVIKRLLRRAVLDGHQLGVKEPFLCKLVGKVAELMRPVYPEISESVNRVSKVIQSEEANFLNTIGGGMERLNNLFDTMKRDSRALVSGNETAELYTTHGFPPELLETLAAEHNLQVDWPGYKAEMEKHSIASGGGVVVDVFGHKPIDTLKKTLEPTRFLGYDTTKGQGTIVGIIAQDQLCETLDEIGHKDPVTVVLDETPFYGESGGQVGDNGTLTADGVEFDVIDTHKDSGFILHIGHLKSGSLKLNQELTATVNEQRRAGIRRAHTATHILHHALQKYVGNHAKQQGSKVSDDELRFDFANHEPVSKEILAQIEAEVNQRVLDVDPVDYKYLPIAEARKTGAMMLFGEKYPEIVRMVSIGEFSKELCGGTHVSNTGQIGMIRVTGEESVASGTRRILAVTGRAALERMRHAESALQEVAVALRTSTTDVPNRVAAMAKEIKDLKKQLASGAKAGVSVEKLIADAQTIGSTTVVIAEAPGAEAQGLRELIDTIRKKTPSSAICLISSAEDKVVIVCGISNDLQAKKLSAGEWIKPVAEAVGGKGGGRPDLAQAGGKQVENIGKALEAAKEKIEALLK